MKPKNFSGSLKIIFSYNFTVFMHHSGKNQFPQC